MISKLNITLTSGLVTALVMSVMVSGCAGDSSRSTPSARAENAPASAQAPQRTTSPSQPEVREKQVQPVSSPPVTSAETRSTREMQSLPVHEKKPAPLSKRRSTSQPTRTAKVENSLDDLLLGTSPSMSAQESGSGSSIRGLSPISQTYATNQHIPTQALESLRAMEAFKVNPEELRRFLEEGHLRQ